MPVSSFFFVAWQQHDVQELCRVMFDALEESLKDTEQVGIFLAQANIFYHFSREMS